MKKVDANTSLEVWVDCPYCENYQNVLDDVKESMGYDLRAEDVDIEITCKECKKTFMIVDINY